MSKISPQEVAAIWTMLGLVVGAAISGIASLRGKRIEKQIANGAKQVSLENLELDRLNALIVGQEARLMHLNERVEFLEKLHTEDEARAEQQEARLKAAETARDANAARITLLEVLVESQKTQIIALKADNAKLAEQIKCQVTECPFHFKAEGVKKGT